MGLYSQWEELAQQERTQEQQKKFWDEYFALETNNYKSILSDPERVREGTLVSLAEEFGMDEIAFTGFLDGINTSLIKPIELERLSSQSKLKLEIDYEKLYYNMLEAKAPWLFTLTEWDGVLSAEKRKAITKEQRASKSYVNEESVGRNDPCPCGSGRKYKKCCGK
ncbi:MAG: SEC-C metal-binding domain-containing protein [Bacillota bacterium]